MYLLLRKILFCFEAEQAHYIAMNGLKLFCKIPFLSSILKNTYTPQKATPVVLMGLKFDNMVGLGAGFDKNAKYLHELCCLGFGFVEIGTVTPIAQDGNEKPRLFRLSKDEALINRMGFNNNGLEAIAQELKKYKAKNSSLIVGGNIGKNKITPNEDAWKDYVTCFNGLHPWVDYFVINVSSPNTPNLRELQDKSMLQTILQKVQQQNFRLPNPKPVLLKIAPDITKEQANDIIDLAFENKLAGLVISNTTIDRLNLHTTASTIHSIGAGGLSGKPVEQKSTQLLQYIASKTNNKLVLIGSGGIFTSTDAQKKLQAGASLLQVWTGFIYKGPSIVKEILKGLN